jgi:hypothetical protein
VLDALALWGMTHRFERPVPDEPVHPDPAILGTKVWLNNFAPKLVGELVWACPEDESPKGPSLCGKRTAIALIFRCRW